MNLVCRFIGHAWEQSVSYVPRFYTCKRCGEPGWQVES